MKAFESSSQLSLYVRQSFARLPAVVEAILKNVCFTTVYKSSDRINRD